MNPSPASLTVLIPVYNSEATLADLVDRILEVLRPHYRSLKVMLVNDGSTDHSHDRALAACRKYNGSVTYMRLARNFGEYNAVMCGLNHVTTDYVAIIDDDFQNPPEEIIKLTSKIGEGYDVVYASYEKKRHNWFRNLGSAFNDWMAVQLLDKPKGLYLSSFKVMNRFLVQVVTQYKGPYPYIDGLILQTTSAIGSVACRHEPRIRGRSGYTLRRLVSLWLRVLTSFSVYPLRLSSIIGGVMAMVGFLLAIFFVVSWSVGGVFIQHQVPPGWASLIVSITIFSGIQLMVLGMIGEYLGRVFLTSNNKPQFVVREYFGMDEPGAS